MVVGNTIDICAWIWWRLAVGLLSERNDEFQTFTAMVHVRSSITRVFHGRMHTGRELFIGFRIQHWSAALIELKHACNYMIKHIKQFKGSI